jgi:hypothetical protein
VPKPPQLAGTPTLSPLAQQTLNGLEHQLGIPAAHVAQFEQAVQTFAGRSAGQFLGGKDKGVYHPSVVVDVPYDTGHSILRTRMTQNLTVTYGVGSVPPEYFVVAIDTIS